MIVSSNNLLKILLPNDNKVLKDALKQADIKTLDSIKKDEINLNDILKNLFMQAKEGTKSNTSIENILKNSNFFKDLGNFTKNLENLLQNISSSKTLVKFEPQLKALLKNIQSLSTQSLRQSIDKSGIFLEANLLLNSKQGISSQNDKVPNFQNDIKAILLKAQDELLLAADSKTNDTLKQVDKLLTQIEYHQLLSLVSNSNSVYIPFIWDLLEDGSINLRAEKEEKFYCEINLNLKEFGETKLLLALYDKNKLDLTFYATKKHFKKAIQQNLFKLKKALNSVDLVLINTNILDLNNENQEKATKTNIYKQNDNLGFGIDIKV